MVKSSQMKRLWTTVLIGTLFLLGWVSQKIRSLQTSYDIQKLENELLREQRRYSELEIEKNSFLSLDHLEKSAKEKLGLIPIQEQDVIQIPLNQEKR